MRKLKHFHARLLKSFNCQNVSACAGLFPTEVMGELTGIHKMFLTTRSALLVVSPIGSDSRGNRSDSAPSQIWAATLAIAASFWVRWDKTWLTSFLVGTFAVLCIYFVNCPGEWVQITLHPEGAGFVRITDENTEKCQKQHSGCWWQPETELWLFMLMGTSHLAPAFRTRAELQCIACIPSTVYSERRVW